MAHQVQVRTRAAATLGKIADPAASTAAIATHRAATLLRRPFSRAAATSGSVEMCATSSITTKPLSAGGYATFEERYQYRAATRAAPLLSIPGMNCTPFCLDARAAL